MNLTVTRRAHRTLHLPLLFIASVLQTLVFTLDESVKSIKKTTAKAHVNQLRKAHNSVLAVHLSAARKLQAAKDHRQAAIALLDSDIAHLRNQVQEAKTANTRHLLEVSREAASVGIPL